MSPTRVAVVAKKATDKAAEQQAELDKKAKALLSLSKSRQTTRIENYVNFKKESAKKNNNSSEKEQNAPSQVLKELREIKELAGSNKEEIKKEIDSLKACMEAKDKEWEEKNDN